MPKVHEHVSQLSNALSKALHYLQRSQQEAGDWFGDVSSDIRPTGFLMNTLCNTGRGPSVETDLIEQYLANTQSALGGWEKWPGSGPNVEVTLIAALTLSIARVRTHSQNRTVAARATADRKTVGHLS